MEARRNDSEQVRPGIKNEGEVSSVVGKYVKAERHETRANNVSNEHLDGVWIFLRGFPVRCGQFEPLDDIGQNNSIEAREDKSPLFVCDIRLIFLETRHFCLLETENDGRRSFVDSGYYSP